MARARSTAAEAMPRQTQAHSMWETGSIVRSEISPKGTGRIMSLDPVARQREARAAGAPHAERVPFARLLETESRRTAHDQHLVAGRARPRCAAPSPARRRRRSRTR